MDDQQLAELLSAANIQSQSAPNRDAPRYMEQEEPQVFDPDEHALQDAIKRSQEDHHQQHDPYEFGESEGNNGGNQQQQQYMYDDSDKHLEMLVGLDDDDDVDKQEYQPRKKGKKKGKKNQ